MVGKEGFFTNERYQPLESKLAKDGCRRSARVARPQNHDMFIRSAHRCSLLKRCGLTGRAIILIFRLIR